MRLLGFYDYTVILTYMSLISAFAGMILSGKGMNTAAVFCLLFCGVCDALRRLRGPDQEKPHRR